MVPVVIAANGVNQAAGELVDKGPPARLRLQGAPPRVGLGVREQRQLRAEALEAKRAFEGLRKAVPVVNVVVKGTVVAVCTPEEGRGL